MNKCRVCRKPGNLKKCALCHKFIHIKCLPQVKNERKSNTLNRRTCGNALYCCPIDKPIVHGEPCYACHGRCHAFRFHVATEAAKKSVPKLMNSPPSTKVVSRSPKANSKPLKPITSKCNTKLPKGRFISKNQYYGCKPPKDARSSIRIPNK